VLLPRGVTLAEAARCNTIAGTASDTIAGTVLTPSPALPVTPDAGSIGVYIERRSGANRASVPSLIERLSKGSR
jgi:hypothetical protein